MKTRAIALASTVRSAFVTVPMSVFGALASVMVSQAGAADIVFTDATADWGITEIGRSFGASVGDVNGDGYADVWVGNHFTTPSLYINQAGEGFADGIGTVIIGFNVDNHGAAWADFDRDGDLDLLELVGGTGSNRLFVNGANGVLANVASTLDIAFVGARGRTPLWFDYDNDGRLDVFITNILGVTTFPVVVRNTGTGFTDVTSSLGVTPVSAKHAQLADLDGDGLLDVVLSGFGAFPGPVYEVRSNVFLNIRISLGLPRYRTTCWPPTRSTLT